MELPSRLCIYTERRSQRFRHFSFKRFGFETDVSHGRNVLFVWIDCNTNSGNHLAILFRANNKFAVIEVMARHLWTLVAILVLRGNGLTRRHVLSINRILIILISMSSLFLTTIVSALIGMTVITGPEKENIDSLQDLLTQDVIPVLQEGSYQKELFVNNSVSVYHTVWQKLKNNLFSLQKISSNASLDDLIHRRIAIIDGIDHLNGYAAQVCHREPSARLYLGDPLAMC